MILTLSPAVRSRSWDVEYVWAHWLAFLVWLLGIFLAHRLLRERLPDHDAFLLPVAGLLSGWGLLTIWRLFPNFGLRQSVWMVIALGVLMLGLRIKPDLGVLRRYKYLWLSGGLLLTALTLLMGTNPLGSGPRLWLGCCGIYLQPSEPLKLLLIIYLAAYFADQIPFSLSPPVPSTSKPASNIPFIPLLAPTLIMTGLALLILLVQRDLGTATIFLVLYATIVYVTSGRIQILIVSLVALVLAALIGYFAFDLVQLRMEAWINPWLDPSGRSYQIVQSILAIANGGMLGRGPGLGNPGLVPIPHSDFIFAAITEESGLIGALGLLLLIALLAQRGVNIAINAANPFQRYLAAGLTAYLIFQSILIIGGNLRLLPLTGVTLPFVSYGGSSLVTSFVSLLLLLLISSQGRAKSLPPATLRPYKQLGVVSLIGITCLSLVLGWWAIVRGPDLLTRTDNPRRAISDRFVQRGSILDRSNDPINTSSGPPGEYQRDYLYPDLSNIIGYTNKIYGQSGLEASMDDVLRGINGNPGITIWWNHLLYGQPPPGLDIRTSLDMELQQVADELLAENTGALVLIDPSNGEVLAMASHPTFDANTLEQDRETLIQDQNAPLFNRASQGLYPAGAALGPVLMAESNSQGDLPELPQTLTYDVEGITLTCAFPPREQTWGEAIASGCPAAVNSLANSLGAEHLLGFYETLGLFTLPQINLPSDSMDLEDISEDPTIDDLVLDLRASPLQVALAVSPLSANGDRPSARLVTAKKTLQAGRVIASTGGEPNPVLNPLSTRSTIQGIRAADLPVWESVSTAYDALDPDRPVSWYVAGTMAEWAGSPLVLVVMIEDDNPELVKDIGRTFLEKVLYP